MRSRRRGPTESSPSDAGTRDHQGVLALVEPFRYADAYELARADRPLLAVLDRVTDPHNLGAVCRSADGAGATGVIVPAHGSAVVTPAVARASAGAVEHLPVAVVTNLARYLDEVKGPDLWVLRRRGWRGCDSDVGGRSRPAGVALVFGAEGKGLQSARSADVRRTRLDPMYGRVESLNVSVAAAVGCCTRRDGVVADGAEEIYLFDGYNLLHAGSFADPRGLVDTLASFVAVRGARGVVVFDGVGRLLLAGRSRSASQSTPTRCSRASRPHARRASDARHQRLDGCGGRRAAELRSSRPRPSSAISSGRRTRRRRRVGSPGSSTRDARTPRTSAQRRVKRVQLQDRTCVLCATSARFTSS